MAIDNGMLKLISFMYNIFIFLIHKAIGTAIKINGNVSFTNNNAEGFDGGALYMLTSSQITLNPGAHLDFVNNTGGYVVCVTGLN